MIFVISYVYTIDFVIVYKTFIESSSIVLSLIFLYCFCMVSLNLLLDPDAKMTTAKLLFFFYSLKFMIFYLIMNKNTN